MTCERIRGVSMQALHMRAVARPCNGCSVQHPMGGMRCLRCLLQALVRCQRALESTYPSVAFQPIDLSHEVRTGYIVCSWERTSFAVMRRLSGNRRKSKDAAGCNAGECSWFAANLALYRAAVGGGDIVRGIGLLIIHPDIICGTPHDEHVRPA